MSLEHETHCSQIAYNWAKKSFDHRKDDVGEPQYDLDGLFVNVLDFHGTKIAISSDGIGTKIELAERMERYDTLGYDLVAMIVDDIITGGFDPTTLSNILDVDIIDHDIVNELMSGLYEAALDANIVISGGEIAALGDRVSGFGKKMHFNWCATGLGILHPSLNHPIDGSFIVPGDLIIGLPSKGFRSNGFTLTRSIMQERFGDEWHTEKYDDKHTWGEALLISSRIYCPLIYDILLEEWGIKGIVHITGGGIAHNLKRVLKKSGIGAILDNLFSPLPIMQHLQELGNVPDEVAYQTWNMGTAMLCIVRKNDADEIIALIDEDGYEAQVVGEVVNLPNIDIIPV